MPLTRNSSRTRTPFRLPLRFPSTLRIIRSKTPNRHTAKPRSSAVLSPSCVARLDQSCDAPAYLYISLLQSRTCELHKRISPTVLSYTVVDFYLVCQRAQNAREQACFNTSSLPKRKGCRARGWTRTQGPLHLPCPALGNRRSMVE